MAEGGREGCGQSRKVGSSPVNFDMFLEAEPQAEPHLAEGAHHRLLLMGSLVHVWCGVNIFGERESAAHPVLRIRDPVPFLTPGSGIRDG